MPCIVGITTNLEQEKKEWKSRVIGLKNWRRRGSFSNKKHAQAKQVRLVQECSESENTCYGHPGSGGPDEKGWIVYSFEYMRKRKKRYRKEAF